MKNTNMRDRNISISTTETNNGKIVNNKIKQHNIDKSNNVTKIYPIHKSNK